MKRSLLGVVATLAVALSGSAFAPVRDGNPSATGEFIDSYGRYVLVEAVQHKDGRVTGQWSRVLATGEMVIGTVDCLAIVDNSAYFAGRFVYDSAGFYTGRYYFMRVTDNGEGSDAAPDSVTGFFNNEAPYNCHDPLWQDALDAAQISGWGGDFTVVSGNIQVRD